MSTSEIVAWCFAVVFGTAGVGMIYFCRAAAAEVDAKIRSILHHEAEIKRLTGIIARQHEENDRLRRLHAEVASALAVYRGKPSPLLRN